MEIEKNDDYFLKLIIEGPTEGLLDVSKKRQLFKDVALHFGGKIVESLFRKRGISAFSITIPYKNHEIIITESDTNPLRMQVNFESLIYYNLVISKEDMIEKLLKKLGKKEIELGNELFDNHYIIQSNDSEITKQLLDKVKCGKILNHGIYSISYQTNKKKGLSKLISAISRTIDDKASYIDLVVLHQLLIDGLIEFNIVSIPV